VCRFFAFFFFFFLELMPLTDPEGISLEPPQGEGKTTGLFSTPLYQTLGHSLIQTHPVSTLPEGTSVPTLLGASSGSHGVLRMGGRGPQQPAQAQALVQAPVLATAGRLIRAVVVMSRAVLILPVAWRRGQYWEAVA